MVLREGMGCGGKNKLSEGSDDCLSQWEQTLPLGDPRHGMVSGAKDAKKGKRQERRERRVCPWKEVDEGQADT